MNDAAKARLACSNTSYEYAVLYVLHLSRTALMFRTYGLASLPPTVENVWLKGSFAFGV